MRIENILNKVEKPARYTGGELNSIVKKDAEVRFVFAFPDTYEIGMSHLGGKIIYDVLNSRPDTQCERVYAPAEDMEQQLRENGIELFSLESGKSIKEADLLGFTLQYEMSYTNILNMLDMAGIPIYSAERKDGVFVFAGGPCAYHAEPIAPFMDFFALGDGEEELEDVVDIYKAWKQSGEEREGFLRRLAAVQGFYVPSLYSFSYNDDGTVKEITADNAPLPAVRRVVEDFEHARIPVAPPVPYIETVHDRIMLEIFRGCTRGCRFCQAGFIYRPIRERSVDTLLCAAVESVKNTGYSELSLSSLSSGDYSGINELTSRLEKEFKGKNIAASLPSLRLDSFDPSFVSEEMRKSSLTFAPEAGSQRLRDVINKNVTDDDFARTMRGVFQAGYTSVKLYFMLGLPTETFEDIEGIAALAKTCTDIYREIKGDMKGLRVVVSTSFFVPKPFTPFQWCAQNTVEEQSEKRRFLADKLKRLRCVEYKYHESRACVVEAALARGDRRLSAVIYEVWKNGGRFDSWGDHFSYTRWERAFDTCGLSLDFYAFRERSIDEVLPWDTVSCGVDRRYFLNELKKAKEGKTTADCRKGCTGCGMNKLMERGECPCAQH